MKEFFYFSIFAICMLCNSCETRLDRSFIGKWIFVHDAGAVDGSRINFPKNLTILHNGNIKSGSLLYDVVENSPKKMILISSNDKEKSYEYFEKEDQLGVVIRKQDGLNYFAFYSRLNKRKKVFPINIPTKWR